MTNEMKYTPDYFELEPEDRPQPCTCTVCHQSTFDIRFHRCGDDGELPFSEPENTIEQPAVRRYGEVQYERAERAEAEVRALMEQIAELEAKHFMAHCPYCKQAFTTRAGTVREVSGEESA